MNANEIEKRNRERRILPEFRRKSRLVLDILSSYAWYSLQFARRRPDPLFVPPGRLPPMPLRMRVNGSRDIYSFLRTGKACADDVERSLARVGRDLKSFRNILDFGCGCGRTLIWLADRVRNSSVCGSDADERAVDWCRNNLQFGRFDTNSAFPPLPYPDDSFDFVYVISLFTHFSEEAQFRWLEELQRVTMRGGIVLATVHGAYCWEDLSGEMISEIQARGFLNVFTDPTWPSTFQTSYHTEAYVREQYSRYFRVLEYVPRGMNDHQDVVLLEVR